ncbi:MAG TPA: biosynthetic peptidoglycan transglycosylase [Spirochaetia bacterium]|nr:biosynthetic peptidoglycan transglycosylase [Spirochaetia bacterium]
MYAPWRHRRAPAAFLFSRALCLFGAGILLAGLACCLVALSFGLLYSVIDPPVTSLMLLRPYEYGYRIEPVRYLRLDEIPKAVQSLVVEAEDSSFYTHGGIDLVSMKAAWKADRELGYFKYGGSTITQQLVRSLFLSTRRNLPRKCAETIMAVVFDLVVSKRRQLELYLNYVEWGKGVYGIQAGALAAYGRPVNALTQDEIVRLIAVLPNPVRYRPKNLPAEGEIAARYDRLRLAASKMGD